MDSVKAFIENHLVSVLLTAFLLLSKEYIFKALKFLIAFFSQVFWRIFRIFWLIRKATSDLKSSYNLKKSEEEKKNKLLKAKKNFEDALKLIDIKTNFNDYYEVMDGLVNSCHELKEHQIVIENFKKFKFYKPKILGNTEKLNKFNSTQFNAADSLSEILKGKNDNLLDVIEEGINWCRELSITENYLKMPKFWFVFGNICWAKWGKIAHDDMAILENIMSHYNKILKLCINRPECIEDSVIAEYNLGKAYFELDGCKKEIEYVKKAKEYEEKSIDEGLSAEKHPKEYAEALNILGLCYHRFFAERDDPENLDKAKEYFKKAAKTKENQEDVSFIPGVHIHLGLVYMDYAKIKEPQENLLHAISECEMAINWIDAKLFTIINKDDDKENLENIAAYAKYHLGKFLLLRSEIKDTKKNLEDAKESLYSSYDYYKKTNNVEYSTNAHCHIMDIECRESDFGDFEKKIEESIIMALECKDYLDTHKVTNPDLLLQFGEAYLKLSYIRKPEDNSYKAIDCFYNANISNNNAFAWGKTQLNYAKAYILLAKIRDRSKNIDKAMEHLDLIKHSNSVKKFPYLYYSIFSNYGILYNYLAEDGGEIENCENALDNYKLANQKITLEIMPIKYAQNRMHEGDTYLCLSQKKSKHYLNYALECYEEAQKILSDEGYILEVAEIDKKKAHVYRMQSKCYANNEMLMHKKSLLLIEKARSSYNKSLKIFTEKYFPVQNSLLKIDMAEILIDKYKITHDNENLYEAIRISLEALSVFTKKEYPLYFITNTAILGKSYLLLKSEDHKWVKMAREYYEKAFATCIDQNCREMDSLRHILYNIYNEKYGLAEAA